MSTLNTHQTIIELLSNELSQANALLQALHDEFDSITNRNLYALEKALEQKLACTAELEQIEQNISHLLKNEGFDAAGPNIEKYMESLTNVNSHWRNVVSELKDIAQKCHHQNEVNGRLINSASGSIRQALNIVTGQDQVYDGYSASGKHDGQKQQNSISVA